MSICFWPTARVSIWICSCTRDGVGRASAEASGKSERLSKRLRCRPRSKTNGSCLLVRGIRNENWPSPEVKDERGSHVS